MTDKPTTENEAQRNARLAQLTGYLHGSVEVLQARGIPNDHWLNDARFAWFKRGYEYASTQTKAIPALAQSNAGHLYFALTAIMRGAGISEPGSADNASNSATPARP